MPYIRHIISLKINPPRFRACKETIVSTTPVPSISTNGLRRYLSSPKCPGVTNDDLATITPTVAATRYCCSLPPAGGFALPVPHQYSRHLYPVAPGTACLPRAYIMASHHSHAKVVLVARQPWPPPDAAPTVHPLFPLPAAQTIKASAANVILSLHADIERLVLYKSCSAATTTPQGHIHLVVITSFLRTNARSSTTSTASRRPRCLTTPCLSCASAHSPPSDVRESLVQRYQEDVLSHSISNRVWSTYQHGLPTRSYQRQIT